MQGLTAKDKELLDYLFDYCRYTTKQLAKALRLPQQTISYKIKRLEEQNYISRYDAILNWDLIPLTKKLYLFNTKKPGEIIKKTIKKKPVHSIHENTGTYNLAIWCFYKNKKQIQEFEEQLPEHKAITINKTTVSDFTHFGTEIKLKKPTMIPSKIKLDKKDISIIKHLSSGRARDSLLQISKDLKISYDITHYRLKRLIRNGYFSRLMPQTGKKLGGLRVTQAIFELKQLNESTIKKIKSLAFMAMGGYSEKFVYLHFMSENHEDYLTKLDALHEIFKENLESTEILHWKELHLANRYPLEYAL